MLIAGCSGSTQLRRSSSEQTSFFFHPLELHLQPADLLVQCFGVEFIVASFPGTTIHKGFLQLLQGRFPPVRNLHRMHLKLRPQLAQRLLSANCLQCHPRFKFCTVAFPRRCHRSSSASTTSSKSNLSGGLNFGVHYSSTT